MFKKYTTKEGLLNNAVYSLQQSKNGLWWIGTSEGLQLFDGYNFESWTQAADKSANNHVTVYNLFEDSKENVWVFNLGFSYVFTAGSKKYKLIQFDSSRVHVFPDNYLFPVMEKDGRIWCYDDNTGFYGINMQTKKIDTLVEVQFKSKQRITTIYTAPFIGKDENDIVWVSQDFADSDYIIQFKPGSPVQKIVLPVNKYGRLKGLIPVGSNQFLFLSTTYTALYNSSNFENPVKILSSENIPGNYVRNLSYEKLKVNNKGSFIFAGNKGIYEYNPSTQKLQPYATSVYPAINLSRQFIFTLKEDEQGNIWIGRDVSDGLLVFYPGKLKFNFLQAPQQYFNMVYSLAADEKGNLFAPNFQKGINVFNNAGKWIKYIDLPKTELGLSPSMRSMNFIDSSHLVMKSLFGRMAVLNTDDYSIRDISNLLPARVSEQITFDACFLKAATDKLLFIHGNYVLQIRKNNGQYAVELIDSLFTERSITSLIQLPNGRLLLGTSGGCYIKNKTQWERIPGTENYYIKHLAADNNNVIWVASTSGILLLNENKIIKTYNVASGLLNEIIYGILFDDDGNAWYSCNKGVGCIKKNGSIKYFTEADGLQSDEFDTDSFWKGADGKLYFGGVKGISAFYPAQVLQLELPVKIIISGIQVNGMNYPDDGRTEDIKAITLPYNKNALTFNFTLSDFGDLSNTVFQVKLIGFDMDWVNLKDLHNIRYSLPPGTYELNIKGSNHGNNSSEVFILPIIIQPAWWQTGWFKILIGLILGLLIFITFWYYSKRKTVKLKQQLQLQQEMQKERERISRDLHDNIGAYSTAMIANTESLEKIITDEEGKKKALYLKDNARNILTSIRDTIWLLNSENPTISVLNEGFINYCSNILRNYEGIEIEFNDDIVQNKHLSPTAAINLLRILQEIIQNIIKHAHATKIHFYLKCDETLSINITDNGIGFNTGTKSYGNGLENMKNRATEINFKLVILTAEGNGTSIAILGNI